ncbi:MAG: CCR4-NOT transcription complex subunit 8 [Marteilia pararefringens]
MDGAQADSIASEMLSSALTDPAFSALDNHTLTQNVDRNDDDDDECDNRELPQNDRHAQEVHHGGLVDQLMRGICKADSGLNSMASGGASLDASCLFGINASECSRMSDVANAMQTTNFDLSTATKSPSLSPTTSHNSDMNLIENNAKLHGGFVNVWRYNIDGAFELLRQTIDSGFTYVAMDTEFPGVVAKPIGDMMDYAYQCLKCNVDLLKIIQLGLTVFDENGNTPDIHTWQFNFKFKINEDMYAQDSIELLKNAGIKFAQHQTDGINILKFARLLITSGLVLMPGIKWISFHGIYDFGYLMKILMNQNLPASEKQFYSLLKLFFKEFYDLKLLTDNKQAFKGGLQDLAHKYKVDRLGQQHQAGSDAYLTGKIFFAMKVINIFLNFLKFLQNNSLEELKNINLQLYGLSSSLQGSNQAAKSLV